MVSTRVLEIHRLLKQLPCIAHALLLHVMIEVGNWEGDVGCGRTVLGRAWQGGGDYNFSGGAGERTRNIWDH